MVSLTDLSKISDLDVRINAKGKFFIGLVATLMELPMNKSYDYVTGISGVLNKIYEWELAKEAQKTEETKEETEKEPV